MNISSRGRRALAAIAVACLALGAAPAAHAAPFLPLGTVLEAHQVVHAWFARLAQRVWNKEGSSISPDGTPAPVDGSTLDEGGLTNEGSSISPDG